MKNKNHLILMLTVIFSLTLTSCHLPAAVPTIENPTEPTPTDEVATIPPTAAPSATPEPSPTPEPEPTPGNDTPLVEGELLDSLTMNKLSNYASYDTFTADESEYQVKILFSTKKSVKNFKFLKLEVTDVDANGNLITKTEAIYNINTLEPDHPLVVTMTFFGTLPSYGFSYEDEGGTVKSFYIAQSGEDGSLLLIPFDKKD